MLLTSSASFRLLQVRLMAAYSFSEWDDHLAPVSLAGGPSIPFLRHGSRPHVPQYQPRRQSRLAASHIDRILRGANPAELPVQASAKYVTSVNLKTAKALGLDMSLSLLALADEVID
jgi:hypothetical protein